MENKLSKRTPEERHGYIAQRLVTDWAVNIMEGECVSLTSITELSKKIQAAMAFEYHHGLRDGEKNTKDKKRFSLLNLLTAPFKRWHHYMNSCEICGMRQFTHVELHPLEAGIRVCDECSKSEGADNEIKKTEG